MTRAFECMRLWMAIVLSATMFAGAPGVAGQQAFPVTSTVNESSIAGRAVALDLLDGGRKPIFFWAELPE